MFGSQRRVAWLVVVLLLLLSLSACTVPFPASSTPAATAKQDVDFSNQLMAAITQHNYGKMQQMMGDQFMWVGWGSKGSELPSAVALIKARNSYFTQSSPIAFYTNKDITTLLGAQNPLTSWSANIKATEAIYTTGLGDRGKDEAILIIAQKPDGARYWYGLLAAPGGFAHRPAASPTTVALAPQSTATLSKTAVLAPTTVARSLVKGQEPHRIQFAAGAVSHDLHGHVAASGSDQYVVHANAGQVMQVAIVSPGKNVGLSITGVEDSVTYKRSADSSPTWRGVLPSNQDYLIKAVAVGSATEYNLHVVIK